MIITVPNAPIPLSMLASNGLSTLFGRARIYDKNALLVDTVSLNHIVDGLYSGLYTPTVEGVYGVVYQFFDDIGFTVPSDFERKIEVLDVDSMRTNILRILGLLHENTVVDQQTYNTNNQLLTARIRAYDSKTNADLAGATGLLFTWHANATFSGQHLTNFKITRDP